MGTSNLLAIFVWGANAQRQFALVKLSSISCTCLHPLEIFLSVVVGIEVLVGLDPGSESIESKFNQAPMMHTSYLQFLNYLGLLTRKYQAVVVTVAETVAIRMFFLML